MRSNCLALVAVVLVVGGFKAVNHSAAHQPTEPTPVELPKLKIVPLVVLKAGETKELLLSTRCTVGITRSEGLQVGEMLDGQFTVDDSDQETNGRVWQRHGLSAEVPDFKKATLFAALPEYEPLKKNGIDAFVVVVAAAKDAQAGLHELHIADATCSGTCVTDFRVLVLAP